MQRVVLFLDYQNVYRGARDCFFDRDAFHTKGQILPAALGRLVASRSNMRDPRVFHQVRVYTGRPSSRRDPRGYAAHMRQVAAWSKAPEVEVIYRPLRYPRAYPHERPQEKGIDVSLAIDFVMMKARSEFDVGIIFSTDTDLVPALEAVCELCGESDALPEVCAWRKETPGRRRLTVGGRNLRCHWLTLDDYRKVEDTTDYNVRPGRSG